MKKKLSKFFEIHQNIGIILRIVCVFFLIVALIGSILGLTKCKKENKVVETNYFINEPIELHDNNFEVIIKSAFTSDEVIIKDKKGKDKNLFGNFININISIRQKEHSILKPHLLKNSNFKLKNHTGVYVLLNAILGAIGWDAIDVHIDNQENGHVMSSAKFSTKKSHSRL